MAHAEITHRFAPAQGFAGAVEAFVERHRKRALYRRTVAELSKLTARERADLGLSAHSLHTAAYEAVYGTR
ncbi:DUF1127 domain-containing protein [Aquicoccus sp. G2-2]|uniref:DUF1127 domain-containing protein n=1 Tax=Aquicoccus sp. G2-2 TaxID=3092120 RepID=UPI002ADF91A9|nr:DUF1127 domain-containing protein [Aquicoccus sp. G2-2]MEA1112637.1 DUF1127 domain-containing protein [Aquicoccus sp. G2-2]